MDTTGFRKTLLRSAVFAMACDGEVHEDEVSSIKKMASESAYFEDLEAAPEARGALDEVAEEGEQAIENHLDELTDLSLTEKQERLVYEVLIQVVYADDKVHPSEREFLKRVKGALETEEQTLIVNFPTHLDLLLHDKSEERTTFSAPAHVPEVDFSEETDSGNFTQ